MATSIAILDRQHRTMGKLHNLRRSTAHQAFIKRRMTTRANDEQLGVQLQRKPPDCSDGMAN
jgi:hypothetical protein